MNCMNSYFMFYILKKAGINIPVYSREKCGSICLCSMPSFPLFIRSMHRCRPACQLRHSPFMLIVMGIVWHHSYVVWRRPLRDVTAESWPNGRSGQLFNFLKCWETDFFRDGYVFPFVMFIYIYFFSCTIQLLTCSVHAVPFLKHFINY